MQIQLSQDETETLRNLLQQRGLELDKEINRTDSFEFKKELQELRRTIERILGKISGPV